MNLSPHILLLTGDALATRGATRVAKRFELEVLVATDPPQSQPAVIVIDLEQPGAIDQVRELREAHSDSYLAGHLAQPDRNRWIEAERAGCDLVANRGALGKQLQAHLKAGSAGRRRFPLLDEADAAGKLGLVATVEETPFGSLAIYSVDGQTSAIDDLCPHAGARLSTGEVSGCVVTCPRHGSQFNVQTGERLRGPADQEVAVHEVLTEKGRIQLVWTD